MLNLIFEFKKKSFQISKMNEFFNKTKSKYLTNIDSKLDLVIQLDYLGFLEIESKYIQTHALPWLIAQVKLFEINKRIFNVYLEINVKSNTINCYRSINKDLTNKKSTKVDLIEHSLTNIFKLCILPGDPNCFGYFYRVNDSFIYTLHVFRSKQCNLAKAIIDFQSQALKIHDTFSYKKVFEFVLIAKVIKNIYFDHTFNLQK